MSVVRGLSASFMSVHSPRFLFICPTLSPSVKPEPQPNSGCFFLLFPHEGRPEGSGGRIRLTDGG